MLCPRVCVPLSARKIRISVVTILSSIESAIAIAWRSSRRDWQVLQCVSFLPLYILGPQRHSARHDREPVEHPVAVVGRAGQLVKCDHQPLGHGPDDRFDTAGLGRGVRAGHVGYPVWPRATAPSAARRAGPRGAAVRSARGRPGVLPRPRPGRSSPAIMPRPAVRPRAAGPRPRGAPGSAPSSGAVSHRRTVKSPEPDASVAPSGLKASDQT